VRVGLGIGWMTLVAAEFAGVRGGYGLGYMILSARDLQRIDMVMAGMAAIGLVGLVMELGLKRLSAHLLRWR
jgi:ABC-type nitrate/sulfonate/bicarbonate transport system permease component